MLFDLDDLNEHLYPACILNDLGVSKTFLIIYKNDEVELDDQFNFKLSVIVDAQNVWEKIILRNALIRIIISFVIYI